MVLCQVREDTDIELASCRALHRQRVRRYLDGGSLDSRRHHPDKELLEVYRLGRGPLSIHLLTGDPGAERTDDTRRLAGMAEDAFGQIRGGRLAVGPRDTD